MTLRHVVSVSSGVGSAYTWHLAVEKYGPENVVGLFADVNGEHPDNYRFLAETHYAIDTRLVKLTNGGRNIFDVMIEGKFLANTRVDLCSRVLKREALLSWMRGYTDPRNTVMHLGIDWTEAHRFLGTSTRKGAQARWAEEGFTTAAPMIDGTLDKSHALRWLADRRIEAPLLTRLGFSHANCGGGCVKAGAKQFKMLLRLLPEWYAWWERGEERVRAVLGADVSILRDRRDSQVRPLTLRRLRELVQAQPELFEEDDLAACGCFTFEDDEAA